MLQGESLEAGAREAARCKLLPAGVPHVLTRPALNADERNSAVQVYLHAALQLLCHQVWVRP
jgi:hypothetical protein